MTDIIENAGQPENTAPAAGEKKPENTPKKEKQPMTFKRLYKEWILPFGLEILALFLSDLKSSQEWKMSQKFSEKTA